MLSVSELVEWRIHHFLVFTKFNCFIMKMKTQKTSKKNLRWLLIIILTLVLVGLWMGVRWATYARPPLPEALEAIQSDEQVTVITDPWLTFSPKQRSPDTGFIFYPGGRVDPRGYATLMKAITTDGYLAVVPEMPINMAVFNPNIADEIIEAHPQIDKWVIGGHSVGGTMAAQYTDKYPENIDGLAIWASYPANRTDISDLEIPVISIYGSLELRVNDENVEKRKYLLPFDTVYIRIEGGDHHQFGSYEIHPDEHLATTSRAAQHQQIIQATLDLLAAVSNQGE
jgi:hypothetical protein